MWLKGLLEKWSALPMFCNFSLIPFVVLHRASFSPNTYRFLPLYFLILLTTKLVYSAVSQHLISINNIFIEVIICCGCSKQWCQQHMPLLVGILTHLVHQHHAHLVEHAQDCIRVPTTIAPTHINKTTNEGNNNIMFIQNRKRTRKNERTAIYFFSSI
eukprot:m.155650 g.155650  ORF g.155650 m.155650 type:complete len:158 (-) comp13326_c0_seq7:37-510(-)